MAEAPKKHEVWVNAGWPDQKRTYIGHDAFEAAMAYSALAERFGTQASGWKEIIWTIDGRAHQRESRVVA